MNYYRWPSGAYEHLGEGMGWFVIKHRPEPFTPAGSVVAQFGTKEEADSAAAALNWEGCTLSQARMRYSAGAEGAA
jgi:hypothetical protein